MAFAIHFLERNFPFVLSGECFEITEKLLILITISLLLKFVSRYKIQVLLFL